MDHAKYLYRKLYDDIRGKIEEGTLSDGERLAPLNALADSYGVSAITVTAALNALRSDGFLVRIKGKGSFVRAPKSAEMPAAALLESGAVQLDSTVMQSAAGITAGASGMPDGAETMDAGKQPPSGAVSVQTARDGVHPDETSETSENRRMIGVVLEHISSCFGLDMYYAMDACARKAGWRICVRFSYGNREQETEEIRFLRALGVSGLILMPCHGRYYSREILRLVVERFPVVLVDKKLEGIDLPSVRTNSRLAMEQLVNDLIARGKQHIALAVAEGNDTSSVRERREGFVCAMKKAGMPLLPECTLPAADGICVYSDELDRETGSRLKNYIDTQPKLDALVFTEYGLIRTLGKTREALRMAGIAVESIDEDYMSPGMDYFSHVRQNERAIAERAVELLLRRIGGSETDGGDYLIDGIFRAEQQS